MTEARSQRAWGRWLNYLALLNLLIIVLAIAGRMLLDWPPMFAFRVFFYGMLIGLALALVALCRLAWSYRKKPAGSIRHTLFSLISALLPALIALIVAGPGALGLPLIHDISTDMDNPPPFSAAAGLRTADDNDHRYAGEAIAQQQRVAYPDIKPLLTRMPVDEALAHSLETALGLGWTVIDFGQSDAETGAAYLEAFAETRLFGFVDDISIRIRPTDAGSRIDIRSASRLGLGDLGANAARIAEFINRFNEPAGGGDFYE